MIYRYDTIDSTMRAAAQLNFGDVVIAGAQTGGQGRHGHSWHSEPGVGIYCSIVMQADYFLTMALGLATVEAISQTTGIACDIRWPNDLMLDDRKAAGILVHVNENKAIAGIGINVNNTSFPPDIEATSLRLHAGREFDREKIIDALLPAAHSFAAMDPETILMLFVEGSSYCAGRRVVVHQPGGDLIGTTAGIDEAGYLILLQDDGSEVLIHAGGVRALSS